MIASWLMLHRTSVALILKFGGVMFITVRKQL